MRRSRDWMTRAACAAPDVDPEIFFAQDGETLTEQRVRVQAARTMCAACPVQPDCLADALAGPRPEGIRAGLTSRQFQNLAAAERRNAHAAEAA